MAILVDPGTSFEASSSADLAAPSAPARTLPPARTAAPPAHPLPPAPAVAGARTAPAPAARAVSPTHTVDLPPWHPSAPSPAWAPVDVEPLPAPQAPRSLPYGAHRGPWAIAHRGGLANAPENTAEAFARASAVGLTYLETDVRVTADGVAVAFHDATLDRVTELTGPVSTRTWAELAATPVLGGGPVARIEDLLAWFPDARFIIDIKEAAAIGPLVAAVRRTRAADRVCVAGGFDGWLAELRDRAGVTSALGWQSLFRLYVAAMSGTHPPRRLAEGGAFAHAAWRLNQLVIMGNPRVAGRLVGMAHDLGLRVVAWTVDAPADVRCLLDQGVDGIIADDAAQLVRTFRSGGLAPTGA
ncbi:glycerophosphodiester phosphodiesterase family protein [Georgenia sp. Z1344]|uniref:glycerophosphodiester phosphodiesterase family protein n=1 Tax=Georgenia sp. Z1344 TaxID=3416706 RepID=UPI003CF1CA05